MKGTNRMNLPTDDPAAGKIEPGAKPGEPAGHVRYRDVPEKPDPKPDERGTFSDRSIDRFDEDVPGGRRRLPRRLI
jgi:hypothetical protein